MCSAEQTLRRVLDIRTEILEDDDPALATSRTSLASVLQRKGKPQEVRPGHIFKRVHMCIR